LRAKRKTKPGYPLPPGVKLDRQGAQFSIFSRHATAVTLILFSSTEPNSEYDEIPFDPVINKTGDIWHIWVGKVTQGQLYGYRIDGPYDPEEGHRFNRNKLLLDPYAKAVTGNFQWDLSDARGYDQTSPRQDLSFSEKDSAQGAPKCIVIGRRFDTFDKQLTIPYQDTIIYELHVKGFTYHQSSKVKQRGTFKGITEKIPYLKELGITAVELMPIQEFDEDENININPITGEKLKNYWGYSTISFLAPRGKYSASGSMGEQVAECKAMISELHRSGIEVILDIVFNHTAEGDHLGPTLCFRGIDNSIYYMLDDNKRFYRNFSGCGNTLNCNHPLVRDFIIECLKYWVIEMQVDGFRFDLASILGRDQNGTILSNPPLLEKISEDPILRNTKIIAEAWDAAGAYQVGDFPGRWGEWNGKFRDDVRHFWRGDENTVRSFATRITGSSDLYYKKNPGPLGSINFITCHDGFTLNDLVSFAEKHNIENGENNLDGENNNLSDNLGIEGLEAPPLIEKLRKQQIKNFLATLFLSQGVPMILAGDEFRRTQRGNNNAYCQDNEISWINWEYLQQHGDIFRFCKEMIGFRKAHPVLRRKTFFQGKCAGENTFDIAWHGIKTGEPDWSPQSHSIACLINGDCVREDYGIPDNDIYMAFNASRYHLDFEIPEAPSGGNWYIAINTSMESPLDILASGEEIFHKDSAIAVRRLSTIVLISR